MTDYAPGRFSWVDLNAHDPQQAVQFYGGLFGWAAVEQDTQGGPPYWIFELTGKQVAAVVNFPAKQIGRFMSECLVLGFMDSDGGVVLVSPDQPVANGQRLH